MEDKMTEDIKHGEKMITFKVRFWTKDLVSPKMVWNSGAITPVTNRSRGIRNTPDDRIFFRSIDDLPRAMKELLKKHGIAVVEREKGTKRTYLVDLD
jgi:hypothetical protein